MGRRSHALSTIVLGITAAAIDSGFMLRIRAQGKRSGFSPVDPHWVPLSPVVFAYHQGGCAIPALTLLKRVGLAGDPNGAWFSYLPVAEGTPLYYLFTVENTGEVPLC
ncbi:MAG: hypothetical protein Kow00124_28500 [Anaerolineae bacterium]